MADNNFLSDFKTYKNIKQDNTDMDDLINQTLDASQDYFEKEYWIYLDSSNNTFTFSGNFQSVLFLPTYYFTLKSVTINSSDINTDNFYVEGNAIYYIDNLYPKGLGNIKINVDLGFSTKDDIPKSLLEAFLIYADRLYEDAINNSNSNVSFTDPVAGKMQLVNKLPDSFYRLLNPHIVYNV